MAGQTIERLLVRIEADAAQLSAELAKGGTAVKRFGADTAQIGAGASGLGQRYASAGVQVSSALENMARAGKVGGEGLKQVITQGSNMAFLFGPQGAVVGAVGIASLAIIELFQRTRDETVKLTAEIKENLDRLQNAGDVSGLTERAKVLFQGTPANDFKDGIKALRSELAALDQQIASAGVFGQLDQKTKAEATRIRTQLKELETEFNDVRRRILAAGPIAARTIDPITTTGRSGAQETADAERAREKAERERERAVKKEEADLERLADKRKRDAEAIAELIRDADIELAQLAGDTIRVLDLQIAAKVEQAKELSATPAQIAAIIKPLEIARASATVLQGALGDIAIDPEVLKRLKAIADEIGASLGDASGAAKLTDNIEAAVGVAVGLATSLAGAGSEMTRLITGAGQLAVGFAKINELKTQAGGLGAAFSGNPLSALGAIGTVIAGAGALASLFGGGQREESPEARALRENLEANSQRLVELRAGIEELTLSLTGAETAAVRDVALTAKTIQAAPITGLPVEREDFRSVDDILKDLRKVGVSLEELRQVAADFGVTLSESPTVLELEQLQEAIRTFSLQRLLDTLDGQLRLLELKARIDPAAFEGLAGVIAKLDVLSGKSGGKGIPAIAKALEGLDPTSPDFAAQAIEKLKALFGNLGTIPLEDFGNIDPDKLPEILAQLIEALQATLPKTQTAGEKFRDAIEQIALQAEFGVLDAEGRLAAVKTAFRAAFGDVADGLDFSSLDALRESVKSIIAGFDDDGELTDAERALAEALRELLGAFEATTPAAVQFTDSLASLLDRFELLGISAKEQVGLLLAEFTSTDAIGNNAKLGLLQGLTDGLDVTSAEGLAALRKRAGDILATLSAGGIDEQEQAVVDALKRILGTAERAASDAARAAEESARQDLARRKRILAQIDQDIDLNDVEDPQEILRRRLKGFVQAFGDVIALPENFENLSAGELDGVITDIIAQLRAMGDGVTVAGIPIEELISALLGLENAGDSATTKILTLAESIAAAFDGIELDLDIAGITDPLERTTRKLRAAADQIPELSAVLGNFALDTEQGRKAAEAALVAFAQGSTDAGVKKLIAQLLADLRGLPAFPDLVAGAAAAPVTASDRRDFVQTAANITEVTANRLVDLFLRNVLATERIDAKFETAVQRMLTAPLPVLQAPALPSFLSGGVGGGRLDGPSGPLVSFALGGINFNGPLTVGDADELARLIQVRVLEVLNGPVLNDLVNAIQRAGIARVGAVKS